MHDINWYSAMTFNRMLGRTGHFWEARYHAVPLRDDDERHALAMLSYVHANPKARKRKKRLQRRSEPAVRTGQRVPSDVE